jgi:hypothetical protein
MVSDPTDPAWMRRLCGATAMNHLRVALSLAGDPMEHAAVQRTIAALRTRLTA